MSDLRLTHDGRWVDPNGPEYDRSLPDPLSVCVPFLKQPPSWVIMGGLGDVDEVGPAKKRWPQARFLGIDPDPRAVRWQQEHSWPEWWERQARSPLLQLALSDKDGTGKIFMDTVCCASMHGENLALAKTEEELQEVRTVTLDALDLSYGPFTDVVLWLDCEGWDVSALLGAYNLLSNGRVKLVNIEVWYRLDNEVMFGFLEGWGFERCLTWFRQWWGHNELWRLR